MANAVAYGFMKLEDIFERRVQEQQAEIIDTAVIESAAFYTRDLNAMLDDLVETVTKRDDKFELPTSGELQPGSENGTPIPTRGVQTIEQGYPMMRGMDSFGLNRESYAKLRVGEMNKMMLNVQSKDARWMIRRLLAAIFTNTSWTFSEPGHASVTVRGLAVTGDGSIYLNDNGELTTANHYTAQASAIDNSNNPYEAQRDILQAHPANIGPIVSYIPANLVSTTSALSDFYEYRGPDSLVDFADDVSLAVDDVANFIGFGNKVLGVVADNIIVESRRLPDNYIISVVQGVEKPLVMRQEPESTLQGLQVVPMVVDSNFRKWDFYRKAGFAVRNPIAMAVRRIGNGSYAIPTGYNAAALAG